MHSTCSSLLTQVPSVYVDCYYDPSLICGRDAYAAVTRVTPYGAYAAVNGFVQPSYLATAPLFWRGLRGGDWVAIHGSGRQQPLVHDPESGKRFSEWIMHKLKDRRRV